MVKTTVFYSWQADLPNSCNRGFIQKALEEAVKAIADDESLQVEPRVDKDTAGVAGSPVIFETILEKIRSSSVFVCDVSIINGESDHKRKTPNPNVLIELGFALATHGWQRMILIANEHFGAIRDLPFDIDRRRVVHYSLGEEETEKGQKRKGLARTLTGALRCILDPNAEASVATAPSQAEPSLSETIRKTKEHDAYRRQWKTTAQGVKETRTAVETILFKELDQIFEKEKDNYEAIGINLSTYNDANSPHLFLTSPYACLRFSWSARFTNDLEESVLLITFASDKHFTRKIREYAYSSDITDSNQVVWITDSRTESISSEALARSMFDEYLLDIKKRLSEA